MEWNGKFEYFWNHDVKWKIPWNLCAMRPILDNLYSRIISIFDTFSENYKLLLPSFDKELLCSRHLIVNIPENTKPQWFAYCIEKNIRRQLWQLVANNLQLLQRKLLTKQMEWCCVLTKMLHISPWLWSSHNRKKILKYKRF